MLVHEPACGSLREIDPRRRRWEYGLSLIHIFGATGVLAICAHLADAAKLALYVPEDDDGEDIY